MLKLTAALLLGLTLSTGCTGNAGTPLNELAKLGQQVKFQTSSCYTGTDTPEDLASLTTAVNSAIEDITRLPEPRDPSQVKLRLERLVREVDYFATEDRDEAYRYAIKIWRAAGMKGESGLFQKSDSDVLGQIPGCQT